MIKVLLTGSTGLLGEYLIRNKPKNYFIVGTFHRVMPRIIAPNVKYVKLDLNDFDQIKNLILEEKPEIIIHSSSLGNVDYCENHKTEARKINILATKALFNSSETIKSKFIFFSTNAVFDGKNPPYDEEASLNPLDYYGKTKQAVETWLQKFNNSREILIIRLMTMYGWNNPSERSNPVTWFIKELNGNNQINVVNDVYNAYLYIEDAAQAVWKLIAKKITGKINISGTEIITRYELALKTAKVFSLPVKLINPVPSSFFPRLAPRPKYNSFNITKVKRLIKFKPKRVEEGLLDMKKKNFS